MTGTRKEIIDLVRESAKFDHIYEMDQSIFLVDQICDLTGFCAPSIRRRMGIWRLDYNFGLIVSQGNLDAEDELKRNFSRGRFVLLPRTIPVEHSMDMIIRDGQLSDWLISDMLQMMRRYCLPRGEALSAIDKEGDPIVTNLKTVYKERFENFISIPLRNPH